jgi:hypothetical protein
MQPDISYFGLYVFNSLSTMYIVILQSDIRSVQNWYSDNGMKFKTGKNLNISSIRKTKYFKFNAIYVAILCPNSRSLSCISIITLNTSS